MTYVKAHARLMVDVRADGMMSEVHVHVHDRVCVCMCVCTGGVTVSFAQQVNLRVAMEGGNSCLRGTKRGDEARRGYQVGRGYRYGIVTAVKWGWGGVQEGY